VVLGLAAQRGLVVGEHVALAGEVVLLVDQDERVLTSLSHSLQREGVETVGASGLAILAITVPLLCLAAIAGFLYWATKKAGRLLFGRSRDNGAARP
jgi:hypothetical protein